MALQNIGADIETAIATLDTRTQNLVGLCESNRQQLETLTGSAKIRGFIEAPRTSDYHLILKDEIGEKISNKINGTTLVNTPSSIQFDNEGKLAVGSYYRTLNIYNESYEVAEIFPVPYGNPSSETDNMGYSFGSAWSPSGSKIAICSWARHVVRIFDSTGNSISQIGVTNSRGDAPEKLNYPRRPLFLDEDRLLIINYQGDGEEADGFDNRGHVSEYNPNTGEFIQTWLGSYGNGSPAIGNNVCDRPIDLDVDKIDSNMVWILERYGNRVLKLDLTTKLIEDIYYPPIGYTFHDAWGVASLTSNRLAVASRTASAIAVVDLETRELVKEIKASSLGIGVDFADVKELSTGDLGVISWSGKSFHVVPQFDKTWVQYDLSALPERATVLTDLLPLNFAPDTGKLSIALNCLDAVPDKIPICYELTLSR